MKCLKTFWPALAAILASGAAGIANAQMPTGGPPGWNAAMTKLFGDIRRTFLCFEPGLVPGHFRLVESTRPAMLRRRF